MMSTATRPAPDFAAARRAMIDSQLRTSGVNAPFVLERMGAVAREDFVPQAARGIAYMDRAVPLGEGQFLAAPVVHGMMLAEARPTKADSCLVVDGGSGYLPALVLPLVGRCEVVAAEDAASGRKRGDHSLLLVDGAVEELPAPLVKRLAEDARVVTGFVRNGVTRLAVGRKVNGEVALLPLAELGIPVLPAFDAPKGWSF